MRGGGGREVQESYAITEESRPIG
jgi:hypothetical protein